MAFSGEQPHEVVDARPTQRLGNQRIEADGDTWQETLAVCEAPNSRRISNSRRRRSDNSDSNNSGSSLIIRSYYQNKRSGKRVWDEPPSGATNILPATDEMRRMAELQLQELHVITGGSTSSLSSAAAQQEEQPKRRLGFFGFGRKKKGSENQSVSSDSASGSNRKIRYKPGSSLVASGRQSSMGSDPQGSFGEDPDALMQQAIALSLMQSERGNSNSTFPSIDESQEGYDEQLAMAKALSLSAAAATGTPKAKSPKKKSSRSRSNSPKQETEEEILARVLEESRLQDAMLRGASLAASEYPEIPDTLTTTSSVATAGAVCDVPPGGSNNVKPLGVSARKKEASPTSVRRRKSRSPVSD